VNPLRRLPLSRLLLLCGLVVALGVSATALASALGSGPTPPPKPLATALHDALSAPAVPGFSANVKLTNHLLEGASLASGDGSGGGGGGEVGQLASGPLISGASGRIWIANDGRVRLELQAEKGDTQVYYDGHTISLYDAAANTLYRYAVPQGSGTGASDPTKQAGDNHEAPSVAKIEEGVAKLSKHANVSGATPGDVAGQPTYTVRVSPNEGGSLIGGGELSWDANHGVPLRAAVFSSTSSSPVIELAATGEVSYGPVASSVFEFKPPADAKIENVTLPEHAGLAGAASAKRAAARAAHAADRRAHAADRAGHPTVTEHGHGIAGVVVAQGKAASPGQKSSSSLPEGLPKVKINGIGASELPTALGTLLSFERSGVRYLVAGFVDPATIEAVARGL
jgi:outer membrane lipoprotein-sorting protein